MTVKPLENTKQSQINMGNPETVSVAAFVVTISKQSIRDAS
jgi:hypothetical protein